MNKAKASSWNLWLLNNLLWWMIPFNKPHGLIITKITDNEVQVKMPYKRRNFNHIKGLHACGLATLCEYACGLQLMNALGADKYRIIMPELTMKYHYQAKKDVIVSFKTSDALATEINEALLVADAILRSFDVPVLDTDGNAICTASVTWQIKPWSKVRTQL